MLGRYAVACTVALTAAVLAAPASASVGIEVGDNFYDPRKATLDLGDGSFDWTWGTNGTTANQHNVVQDEGLFDSGPPVTTMPGGFSVTASGGSFPYYCTLHGAPGGIGMAGVVKVRPVAGEKQGGGVRVSWASDETTTGTKFDVRYQARSRKGKKKWKPWRKKTKKTSGVFGRKKEPVKLGNKPVKLQVRSRQGKARSDWSPKLKLTK